MEKHLKSVSNIQMLWASEGKLFMFVYGDTKVSDVAPNAQESSNKERLAYIDLDTGRDLAARLDWILRLREEWNMNLEIKNLKKQYGKQAALNDLSITFEPGIYGILGANGAGKSTMMNLLTDNLKRDGGEILWNGTDILTLGQKFRGLLGVYAPAAGVL